MSGRTPDHAVGVPLTTQEWHSAAFLHWPLDARDLQPLVPDGLTIDTFDGAAWLGVVPFVMRRVRAAPVPVPVVPDFVEINVRTYVTAPDGSDGVHFFSLGCDRRRVIAWLGAVGLNYVRTHAELRGDATRLEYSSTRRGGLAGSRMHVVAGRAIDEPSPLEDFLTGRWNAYVRRLGRLWRVPVEHEPWPLHEARAEADVAGLLRADGLPDVAGEPLTHWAPAVQVRIGPHRPA